MSRTRVSWQDLVGRRVVAGDGVVVGRVVDLVVGPVGGRVVLVGLTVGRRALLARIGPGRLIDRRLGRIEVPWEAIAELGQEIRLTISEQHLRASRPGEGKR